MMTGIKSFLACSTTDALSTLGERIGVVVGDVLTTLELASWGSLAPIEVVKPVNSSSSVANKSSTAASDVGDLDVRASRLFFSMTCFPCASAEAMISSAYPDLN